MRSRKIILFIVEGITDQTCLGYVLHELLHAGEVQFELADGDITSRVGSSPGNIVSKVGNIVRSFSGNIFRPGDFLEVVHLIDMDGAFIPDDAIKSGDCNKPYYTPEHIITDKIDSIVKRNKRKSENVEALIRLKKVWKTIPYSVYYFSCNLDHVMYDKQNLTRQEKNQYSVRFEKQYADHPERFVNFLNQADIAVKGDYGDTWAFIKEECNSLKRYQNFHVFFQRVNGE